MYLKKLQILNYKNLKNTVFDFEKGANTIIGENDSGKSNAMTALRILLDSSFYYDKKRLKESDFSDALGDWRGHWIIISACFDEITSEDKTVEICKDIIPNIEDEDFLKSFIRCRDTNYGTVTLYIRPNLSTRKRLFEKSGVEEFDDIRQEITLEDYEFVYTSKSQVIFGENECYYDIVGKLEEKIYRNPDDANSLILGTRIDVLEMWQHISVVFIDALRDVETDMKKTQNPIRRIVNTIKCQIEEMDIEDVKTQINNLNGKISQIPEIAKIGTSINLKLQETIGMVYSPNIKVESQLKDDIEVISRYLTMSPANSKDLEYLGLGHLNMIYIALKLVEFEYRKKRELLNLMIVEEPEAHIHPHIQKTLFENLKVAKQYTQVLMTTHSTYLSEVSDISKVNIMKNQGSYSVVMRPTNRLDEFGKNVLNLKKDISLSTCLERYLDAKRSILLFSKGVILVEGDGEEILIPSLVKKVLGVSLDELGIGLINTGSVAFQNIACIFDQERLQRKCALITDLDTYIDGTKKGSPTAFKLGVSRKQTLDTVFKDNNYVEVFYAPHTLEYDFVVEENHIFIENVIEKHYSHKATIDKHKNSLKGEEGVKYDSILTVAKEIGKGWYATLLAECVDSSAVIPSYILKAVVFAAQESMSLLIKEKMCYYSLCEYSEPDNELLETYRDIGSSNDVINFIKEFMRKYESDMVTCFLRECEKYE